MKIKVISHSRPTMFLWFGRVYVTSEYLTVASDRCLLAALSHELGHKQQYKVMLAITLITIAIFIQLFLLLPQVLFFSFPLVYLWFCFLCRLGEYHADKYALECTNLESMREMLQIEGSRMDTRLSMLFYLFRW